jgi:Fic family protein
MLSIGDSNSQENAAQNLARVSDYIRREHHTSPDAEKLLLLHKMLMANIDEGIAGRFRAEGEFVQVGTHVAPAPEQVEGLINMMFVTFESDIMANLVRRIARLHLEFERIHPFNDGNGRIGRVLINLALHRAGFPPVIVRNKGKEKYYQMLRQYDASRKSTLFESHLTLLMLESLHRRIAYLSASEICTVVESARRQGVATNVSLNHARRQTIPAFRERGVWKIAVTPNL